MLDIRRPNKHFIIGVLILLLGFVLLLDQLGFVEANKIFLFWPLILIYFGLHKFFERSDMVGRFWGGFITLLGISFQLELLGISRIRIGTIWPVFLICVGILLILQRYESRNRWEDGPPPPTPPRPPEPPLGAAQPTPTTNDTSSAGTSTCGSAQTQSNFADDRQWPPSGPAQPWEQQFNRQMNEFGERMRSGWHEGRGWSNSSSPRLNDVHIFWGGRRRIVTKNFEGGEIVTIFGGFELDLTEADFPEDRVQIDVVTIFGGGEIRIPANWNVVLETVGIFGGSSDRTRRAGAQNQAAPGAPASAAPAPKKLIIKGVSIFGGLNVKN